MFIMRPGFPSCEIIDFFCHAVYNGCMKLFSDPKYTVERAVLCDAVEFERGEVVADTHRIAAVKVQGTYKCVLADIDEFYALADEYGLYGHVCLLGAPEDTPARLGFDSMPCKTFAYKQAMPPMVSAPKGVVIKRLAPTLAETVFSKYNKYYTVDELAELMRVKGVFGAISDGALAGFIGMHADGNIGIFVVDERFRRRGIGSALERFMINYIKTFGRVPTLDVFADNEPSIKMQQSLGMTEASGFTFWGDIFRR